jgi:alkylation response protein AidB-like acyl-CoA dehydrogenase
VPHVLSETQQAVLDVAREVFDRAADPAEVTWSTLAGAGLLSLVVPQEHGGEGLGLPELGELLREVGRRAAYLPVWETFACGVLPVARCGTLAQRKRLLTGVAEGRSRLTAATAEPGTAFPRRPRTRLVRHADGWRLTGCVTGVGAYDDAAAVLVPASVEDGTEGSVVVAIVVPGSPGIEATPTYTSRGEAAHTLRLTDVALSDEDVLGGTPGSDAAAEAARVLREHAIAGLCLLGDGLVQGATTLTAGYVKERRQFGRALAEFQAVAVQVADVYVAARTVGLAGEAAAWRVASDLPADDDLAVAAYWFATAGPQALHTCHHLHGGVGVDITYPLHRAYSWVKDVAQALGGERQALAGVPTVETAGKNLELTGEQRAFKTEVRRYFETLVTPEDRRTLLTERHGETYHRIIKQMGADGWMGVGWPEEYGGRGLGEVEQQVFVNEAARADVHLPAVTLQTVGPTLMAHGTQAQKDRFLADILSGDVHFAIGYSEPDAGTDLASLRCHARRDGDHYVVNGQKTWTTGGHAADYVWLAVRTDPDAPKHRGISVLIVDTRDPGYSWTPIITADGSHHVNATYYNEVRVPVDMLVGEENQGWRLITSQLNHERVMLAPAGRFEGLRDLVRDWAERRDAPDGRTVAEQEDVRAVLAQVTATFRVNELLNWQIAEAASAGEPAVADASASKVFASERLQAVGRQVEEIVRRYGDPADPETDELLRYLDTQAKRYLVLTFGGGVNEVQRELVCMFGLGLPRVPR